MKNFKKFIKEAHLGNPLNEVDRATNVDRMLSGDIESPEFDIRDVMDDLEAEREEDEGYDWLKNPTEKDKEYLRKKYESWNEMHPDDQVDIEKAMKGIYEMNEENEEFSSTEEKMINQIKSYKKRGSAMINLPSKVRDFYFKNKEKIDALNENMGEWPKELTSRYSDEYRFELEKVSPTYQDKPGRAKYRVIDIESGELKGTPVFGKPESLMAYADDLIKPQGGTQSTNLGESLEEDMNDPVLIKTRAAQMKRDAIDKKDLENKSKRISADEAIDLRYELSILDKEREDILMRIEDIGVEMEQTSEPEGGPIADKLGERLMAADKELRAVNNKIIDIKDDLGVFDMNESLNKSLKEALNKRLGK